MDKMSATTILIIDDEPDIREILRFALESADYRTLEASHAEEARKSILADAPDLILLDWMLPGRSGLELAQQLKRNQKTRSIPIIMVSSKGDETDRIKGLDAGEVDDYVTKPFSPRELVSRVKAVLRRTLPDRPGGGIEVSGLSLDHASHRVSADGRRLAIAPIEYRLLHFFMTHPDRAYSRSQLLDQVWGNQVYVEERTVDVHIRRLRKILEPTGHHRLLQTVRGVGYRFSDRD